MEGVVLKNNSSMLKFMGQIGFAVKACEDDPGLVKVSKAL
jgi:hypothetical protein